jgi:ubiquinone/menaquinone biosynthesis C-methylase UbiE
MYSSEAFRQVEAHYAHGNLEGAILDALVAAGKDPGTLKAEDLAPIDEFHVRGRKATLEFARDVGFEKEMQVLDVGSGIGGASRFIAQEFGCHVTGLDLSAEYCRVAAGLTQRLGLDARVTFRQGNAVDIPFPDASFDIVWTQHAAMNIPDKTRLYREIWRVIRPGGKLAVYDVLAGPGGDPYFPVPWAREPATSFLVTSRQLLDIITETGFEVLVWRNVTDECRSWFRHMQEKMRKDSPPLGLHLLLGPEFRRMAHNQFLNLEEDRIALIEAVVRRPVNI